MNKTSKIIFLTFISLSSFCAISRADILVGPRVGVIMSDITSSDQYTNELEFGYQAGVFGRFSFPYVYIQPELHFTDSGTTYSTKGTKHPLRYQKIDLPVVIGTTIAKIVRIQAGPVISWLVNAKDDKVDVLKNYSEFNVRYQAGIGLDLFERILLDLKFEGNLTDFGKTIANQTLDHKEWLVILSVGINLL